MLGIEDPASWRCCANSASRRVCSRWGRELSAQRTVIRVLSKHPCFGARSNSTKIQPFTGCACTKRVPFRYRFDEKPLDLSVRRRSGFPSVRAYRKPREQGVALKAGARELLPPRNLFLRNPASVAGRAKDGSLPDAHQRKEGPCPPQEMAFYAESYRNISGHE